MDICTIILNYNSYEDTKKIVLNISNIINDNGLENKIIIIDNNSFDNSYNKLKKLFINNHNIVILKTSENKGYSNGNNYGIKYGIAKFNPKYFLIVNPDVEIPPLFLENMKQYLDSDQNLAAITGVMKKSSLEAFPDIAWKLPKNFDDVILNIMLLSIFKNPVKYNYYSLKKNNEGVLYVDCIPGACFMIRSDVMERIGFFDENYFLYCEERTLAKKIKDIRMKTGISLNDYFIHNHKNQKNLKNSLLHKIWLYKSRYYYNIHYTQFGKLFSPLIILSSIVGLFETIVVFVIRYSTNQ